MVKEELQPSYAQPIVTQIEAADAFYEAEGYHQKYAEHTGRGMCHIPYEPISK
jgi:peptide-methionine (S)-S-oxide reductase